jgi:hypothetical protein
MNLPASAPIATPPKAVTSSAAPRIALCSRPAWTSASFTAMPASTMTKHSASHIPSRTRSRDSTSIS